MNDNETLTLLIVFGSVRSQRQGIRFARFLKARVEAAGHKAELADPAEIELPLLDKRYMHFDAGTAPEPMQRLAGMIERADGVLVVSAEYNHGMPPALKNLLDHFLQEWYHRPAAIACYSGGRFGGVRAAMQLRMTLPELGMPTISSLLPLPEVGKALSEDGADQTEWLTAAADKFIAELAWWATAAKREKQRSGPPF